MCQCKEAGEGIRPDEREEDDVIRINPCTDIQYPYTEEGKPACLSEACPKWDSCKVCCKDWRQR